MEEKWHRNELDEHADIKGIEYEGKIRTSEDLDAMWDAKLNEIYAETEETGANDAASSTVPSSEGMTKTEIPGLSFGIPEDADNVIYR